MAAWWEGLCGMKAERRGAYGQGGRVCGMGEGRSRVEWPWGGLCAVLVWRLHVARIHSISSLNFRGVCQHWNKPFSC